MKTVSEPGGQPERAAHSADETQAVPSVREGQRKLFFGLFIFPLLIAVGMAILLCSVVLLTNEEETPESLITAIKTGAPSKRWQKAFELSNELNGKQDGIRTQGVLREIIHILGDPEHYDAKTRSYMAIALSHFHDPEAMEALAKALKDDSEDVILYALWGLGTLEAKSYVPQITEFLQSRNDQLRKTAVYVLGVLGDKKSIDVIKPLLEDTTPDVRWNAALSLARLGDETGGPVLLKMTEREDLASQYQLNEEQIEKIMVNAVKGLALVGGDTAGAVLQTLSHEDKSLKVRQAAIEAIQYRKVQKQNLARENVLK